MPPYVVSGMRGIKFILVFPGLLGVCTAKHISKEIFIEIFSGIHYYKNMQVIVLSSGRLLRVVQEGAGLWMRGAPSSCYYKIIQH